MRHYVKPNHKFVLLINESANPIYSAQHIGRVNSKMTQEIEKNPDMSFRVMPREEWLDYSNEMVEIEFIPQHNPEKDENGKYIVKKMMLNRSSLNTCCDPRTDAFWSM